MKLLTSDQCSIIHTAKKGCQCPARARALRDASDLDLHQRSASERRFTHATNAGEASVTAQLIVFVGGFTWEENALGVVRASFRAH